jgi:hypothetical protein
MTHLSIIVTASALQHTVLDYDAGPVADTPARAHVCTASVRHPLQANTLLAAGCSPAMVRPRLPTRLDGPGRQVWWCWADTLGQNVCS